MHRAFFIEENPQNIDENEIIARYQGKFSEYSFKPSKNMPGFYLIKDSVENRDNTDLISNKIQKFIFSDCEKTFDDIVSHQREIALSKNIINGLNSITKQKIHKNIFTISENSQISSNLSDICAQNLSIIKPVELQSKRAQLMQKNFVKYQILAPNDNFIQPKEQIFCPKMINISPNLLKTAKNDEIFAQNDEISSEIVFGKGIKIEVEIVKSIFLLIKGYDENSDKFIFDTNKMPPKANYRYSIFKDRFEMKINAEISYQNALNLLKTFAYSSKNTHKSKTIILSVNGKTIYEKQFGE